MARSSSARADQSADGEDADRWREEAPVLAGIAAASVQGRLALGERAGGAVRRGGASAELLALAPQGLGPCHARSNGFDLHANIVVPARDRARLERLCRYALRPRINLLLYYGVLGARSAWRSRIAAIDGERLEARRDDGPAEQAAPRPRTNWLWAELMQRSFGFDVLACPRCGDRLELIALIEDPNVIRRILSHLCVPSEVPAARLARPPPLGRPGRWDDEAVAAP